MNFLIVSNNPLVRDTYEAKYNVEYFDVSYVGLLNKVKKYCEEGHKILSHPLSGSVKPKETPYKSVLVSKSKGEIDINSLRIIINSLDSCDKFDKINNGNNQADKDFQLVDCSLISSALESAYNCNV